MVLPALCPYVTLFSLFYCVFAGPPWRPRRHQGGRGAAGRGLHREVWHLCQLRGAHSDHTGAPPAPQTPCCFFHIVVAHATTLGRSGQPAAALQALCLFHTHVVAHAIILGRSGRSCVPGACAQVEGLCPEILLSMLTFTRRKCLATFGQTLTAAA